MSVTLFLRRVLVPLLSPPDSDLHDKDLQVSEEKLREFIYYGIVCLSNIFSVCGGVVHTQDILLQLLEWAKLRVKESPVVHFLVCDIMKRMGEATQLNNVPSKVLISDTSHPCVKVNERGEIRNDTCEYQNILLPIPMGGTGNADAWCKFSVTAIQPGVSGYRPDFALGFIAIEDNTDTAGKVTEQLGRRKLGCDLRSWAYVPGSRQRRHYHRYRFLPRYTPDMTVIADLSDGTLSFELDITPTAAEAGQGEGSASKKRKQQLREEEKRAEAFTCVGDFDAMMREMPDEETDDIQLFSDDFTLHPAIMLGPMQQVRVAELVEVFKASKPAVCSAALAITVDEKGNGGSSNLDRSTRSMNGGPHSKRVKKE
mmetsp:Transcript_25519/g.63910  ORF Transcript_25519/g.63910 Transcript_25519/m.63910 type:complete len:370 (-) Transcript_25519:3050-4159(-)